MSNDNTKDVVPCGCKDNEQPKIVELSEDGVLEVDVRPQTDQTPDVPEGGGRKMNFMKGVMDYTRTKFGKLIDDKTRKMRRALCQHCKQVVVDVDDKETVERLFRTIDGVNYCGEPFVDKPNRNEFKDGCGCDVDDKVKWKNSACPRGLWGPDGKFGQGVFAIYHHEDKDPLVDVVDVHLMSQYSPPDITGIGDCIAFLPVIRAYADMRAREGKRVRFAIPSSLELWARLGFQDLRFTDDPDASPGEEQLHPNPHGALPMNLDCFMTGVNWHQWWGKQLGVEPEEMGFVKPTPEYDLEARQRMAEPINNDRPIVAMSPFANSQQRCWPRRHFIELEQQLHEAGCYVFILDGPDPARTAIFKGQRYFGWKPEAIAGLLANATIHVGNDSSMNHLCGVMNIPSAVIAAPTSTNVIYGAYKSTIPIQAPGICTECHWSTERGFRRACADSCELLMDLKPKAVFDVLMEQIELIRSDTAVVVGKENDNA